MDYHVLWYPSIQGTLNDDGTIHVNRVCLCILFCIIIPWPRHNSCRKEVCGNVWLPHGCLDVSYRSWDKSKNPYLCINCTFPNLVHHHLEGTVWGLALPRPYWCTSLGNVISAQAWFLAIMLLMYGFQLTPDYNTLGKCDYLDQCIDETLRMYPPALQ